VKTPVYGIEALRRYREQQAAVGDPAAERALSEAHEENVQSSCIESEIDDGDDAFEALYEAWIDLGMESR